MKNGRKIIVTGGVDVSAMYIIGIIGARVYDMKKKIFKKKNGRAISRK